MLISNFGCNESRFKGVDSQSEMQMADSSLNRFTKATVFSKRNSVIYVFALTNFVFFCI